MVYVHRKTCPLHSSICQAGRNISDKLKIFCKTAHYLILITCSEAGFHQFSAAIAYILVSEGKLWT